MDNPEIDFEKLDELLAAPTPEQKSAAENTFQRIVESLKGERRPKYLHPRKDGRKVDDEDFFQGDRLLEAWYGPDWREKIKNRPSLGEILKRPQPRLPKYAEDSLDDIE